MVSTAVESVYCSSCHMFWAVLYMMVCQVVLYVCSSVDDAVSILVHFWGCLNLLTHCWWCHEYFDHRDWYSNSMMLVHCWWCHEYVGPLLMMSCIYRSTFDDVWIYWPTVDDVMRMLFHCNMCCVVWLAGVWHVPPCSWSLCLGSTTLFSPSHPRTSARGRDWCSSNASAPSRCVMLLMWQCNIPNTFYTWV